MAKINISFNNKKYQIDEASLQTAITTFRHHLSTAMNGTGATINFNDESFSIDSAKLTIATNAFVSHLGTIAGSGEKVVVNGTDYSIDFTKLTDAISDIEAALASTGEERLEGDGAEYYTLAPTALSFRSTAPLNELQEIQIDGVTVDPSNYTLEEGSTIVTFPIEYLKTLDVGNYEVAVASESKTVKGDFTVAAPELNEHGFYYNQPYTANLPMFGGDTAFFVREDGTFDIITVGKDLTTSTYTVDGNNIVAIVPPLGTVNCTISADGTSIYCNQVATNFELNGSNTIAADDDYVYVYVEDLDGYEVKPIDKTRAEYGAIKTGINGIDTVKLADEMFVYYDENGNAIENAILTSIPEIPNTVTTIGENAFAGCSNLKLVEITNGVTRIGAGAFGACTNLVSVTIPDSITNIEDYSFGKSQNLVSIIFTGTVAQWNAIAFGVNWNNRVPATYVQCSDGQVTL